MMSKRKISWGVLSTAKIGMEKVIPAMLQCDNLEIVGIASRNEDKAKVVAGKLGIPKFYGSYEALLEDPEIEAIYNPLPNHLHYEWTKKAIEKGKHVLCEKPMTINKTEIKDLIALRDKHNVKVGEAFMVHTHPQWVDVVSRVRKGELGKLRAIQGFFSYYKTDPDNIRNIHEYGGGAMWDIGCYPIHTSRFVFGEEPLRVLSLIDRDPELKIDRLGSIILDYPSGQCNFTVSTQLVAYQRMMFFGEERKLEIEIPFNVPNDRKSKVFLDDGDLFQSNREEKLFDICDQYKVQGEAFSDAIISNIDVPVSLEDAYKNTSVIEAIFESEKKGNWIEIEK
jgi:predicted dehydrogenase